MSPDSMHAIERRHLLGDGHSILCSTSNLPDINDLASAIN